MRSSLAVCAAILAPGLLLAQHYFPPDVLGRNPQEHEFKANWYSKHLKTLREPSLWELSQQNPHAEVYRFLWLRSFDHPIAIRLVVRANGSGWINSRMTSGQGGYEPGRIQRSRVSWLRKKQTESFLMALDHAGFWNLPTLPDETNVVGLDGAQWILEGVRAGKYHVVDRWSPEARDPTRAIGLLALELGRFKIRPQKIY